MNQPSDTPAVDRRSGARRKARRAMRPVWVRERAGTDEYLHCARDVSEGGAFFSHAIPRVVGSLLALELEIPGEAESIVVDGRVVRVREDGAPGVAVQFVRMAAADQWRLRRYVTGAATSKLSDRRTR